VALLYEEKCLILPQHQCLYTPRGARWKPLVVDL